MLPVDCRMYKTKNHSQCVDAHFLDVAASVSCAVWAITPTNTFTLERRDNAALRLSNVKDWTSLTHHCRLFLEWGYDKLPSYTQSLYATNGILIIDIQYGISDYYCLHSEVLWPHDFWSTSMHIIEVRDDVALSHSWAFGWQLTAYWSFH